MAEPPRRGFGSAAEARARLGSSAPTFNELAPEVKIGSLVRSLPQSQVDRFADAFLDAFFDIDPALLDRRPQVRTSLGDLPVHEVHRQDLLVDLELRRRTADPQTAAHAERLLAGAHLLEQPLHTLDERWQAVRVRLQTVLNRVEQRATQLAIAFLLRQQATAITESWRYLGEPGRTVPGHRLTPAQERADLRSTAQKLVQARKDNKVDTLIRTELVVNVLTAGFTAAVVLGALHTGQFTVAAPWRQDTVTDLDPEVWQLLETAERRQKVASAATMVAVNAYLEAWTTAAALHPLCLIVDLDEASRSDFGLMQAISKAVSANGDAVHRLTEQLRRSTVIGNPAKGTPKPDELTVTGLVARLTTAPSESIWAMPFFVTRAVTELAPTQARMARSALELSARQDPDGAIARGLLLDSVDAAVGLAPLAGPVGIAIALASALRTLADTIATYSQLRALLKASVDPGVLLSNPVRGPSVLPIGLALLGLWVK